MFHRMLILATTIIALGLSEAVAFDPAEVVSQVTRNSQADAGRVPNSGWLNGEFMVDTTIFYVSTPQLQTEPAVAFDGTNYLVVWEDHRDDMDVYGARVTPDGVVLDREGIAISAAAGSQGSPSVAFDGTNFLVVWDDTRNGALDDIYGARVSPAGVVLDRTGFVISRADRYQFAPSVAFGGTDYLVVWTDSRRGGDQTDVYGARVTRTGQVLDTAGIEVGVYSYLQQYPALAFDGANWLVVWHHLIVPGYEDIHGARVSQSGVALDTFIISAADSAQAAPAVAFDGANYLVAWQDERNRPTDDIYAARVTPAGVVLDPDGFAVSAADLWQNAPSVAFDGTNFLVAWADLRSMSTDIYAARVTPAGDVLDPDGFAVSDADNSQTIPALAFDGTNYLAVWEDVRSVSSGDIYGARIAPAGAVLDPLGIAITATVNVQYYPAAASDGSNYLVAWADDRNGDFDIYGARITPTGEVLDTAALALSTADGDQSTPVLAFDGTNYLVAWEDKRNGSEPDIYGTRVAPDGGVLNRNGFPVSAIRNRQQAPALAFDGSNYLVVWQDFRDGSNYKIYGTRVTPAGAVLDSLGLPISTQNCYQYAPGIAFDGANYLVAWMDYRLDPYYDIYGARVTPAGTVLDPTGFVIAAAANTQRYPMIASDGTNCLVIWDDTRSGQANIRGTRVSQAGAVLDSGGFALWTSLRQQLTPKVAFDGADWLAVWQDRRNGGSNIYGARVNANGTTVDSFIVSRQSDDQWGPAVACGSGSNALAVFFGWTDTLFGEIYEAFRVWARPAPFSPIGIAERPLARGQDRVLHRATVVRGVLELAQGASHKPQAASLLDVSGRKVLDLKPGPNDISQLAPGIYFVREQLKPKQQTQAARTVVIAR